MAKRLGVQTTAKSLFGGLFCTTLRIMANRLPPNERVAPKPKDWEEDGRCKRSKLTDDQVREARRLYDAAEMSCAQIAAHLNVDRIYMRKVLDGTLRSKVV